MKVIATAGHVDHGKSTLIRALTGMEPDRWAEERRRGMTIDLGYAWTALDPSNPEEKLAFVDVPGHQRFITNMLAGVGPVPAVLLVIAADTGWGRQTSEHLDAIDSLGITHAVVALTRGDLATDADLARVTQDAHRRLDDSRLAGSPVIPVSAVTGAGLPQLRHALLELTSSMPEPATTTRVRMWVDRCFTVNGAGTVVTGTLGAGRIAIGDQLELRHRRYAVRGLQQLGDPVGAATAVARVALNLRGLDRDGAARGDCLLTPGTWHHTDTVDVVFDPLLADPVGELRLHIGSASLPVRVRMLADTAARLTLTRRIPVIVGDRGVLRDPGQQSVVGGVKVLDPDPPALRRRGAARSRAAELIDGSAAIVGGQVQRRGFVRATTLTSLGINVVEAPNVLPHRGWLVARQTWDQWVSTLTRLVDEHAEADPRDPWLTGDAARKAVGVPDTELLTALAADAGLHEEGGRLGRPGVTPGLGCAKPALDVIVRRLELNPFDAPGRDELLELGLGHRDLAAAERAGMLLRLAPDVVVSPDAVQRAAVLLSSLAPMFTVSDARQALATSRRVALPLLQHLDQEGITVRHDDERRSVKSRSTQRRDNHPA